MSCHCCRLSPSTVWFTPTPFPLVDFTDWLPKVNWWSWHLFHKIGLNSKRTHCLTWKDFTHSVPNKAYFYSQSHFTEWFNLIQNLRLPHCLLQFSISCSCKILHKIQFDNDQLHWKDSSSAFPNKSISLKHRYCSRYFLKLKVKYYETT